MNRIRTSLLFAAGFVFAAGFSTAVFAAGCNAQALLACERVYYRCTDQPADCYRVFERCMDLAGCEIPFPSP